jgi:hypothetical protein
MRLICEQLKIVGPEPTGPHVYLWSHEGVARYVGRSDGDVKRWSAHLKTTRLDFPVKRRYFEQYKSEMVCHIVREGLSIAEAADLETALIKTHGFLADRTGTLLNARAGAAVPTKRGAQKAFYIRLWWRLMKEGEIAPNAVIRRVIARNPKKLSSKGPSFGYENFEFYPEPGELVTVAAYNAKVINERFTASEQHGHLTYDATVGFIAITLPEGETAAPGYMVPTKDLLHLLALEVGTETDWQKHCAFRARQGGKVGG